MSGNTEEALGVLRAVWSAQEQRAEDVEEDCGPVKACKRMADVGFHDMAEDDGDLRAAWRDRLQREGKLNPEGGSVADLILGPAKPRP